LKALCFSKGPSQVKEEYSPSTEQRKHKISPSCEATLFRFTGEKQMSTPLTIAMTAKRLNISEYSARVLARSGKLKAFKACKRSWRIDEKDLEEYVNSKKEKPKNH
jgi:excisionase family DNA binding protein